MIRSTKPEALSLPLFCLIWALLILAPAALFSTALAELGRVDFVNSGSEKAQEPFVRGVLLLHSFEYDDAREAFQEAQGIDSDFAMAYWGEAMTHNHPLWRRVDTEAALEALGRLAPTHEERLAKAATERERGYLQALSALYGEGDKGERDRAYSAAMGRLAERYPQDMEARAFYALSVLGTQNGVRDFPTYMRAGAIAEEVFAASPRHPGAVHYLIHSYDDPVHAPLGLRAARVYADIAPAASHAQHMISHIFVALGRWEESVESNLESFEVSRERAERKGLGVDKLNFHSLQWLAYSYLQLGRFDEARTLLDQMEGYAAESESERARGYHASMRAAWVVETGKDAPGGHGVASGESSAVILDHFATGYAALAGGDHAAAEAAYAGLSEELDRLAGDADASPETRTQGRVMHKSLRALLEAADGEQAVALSLLEEASTAEAALPMDFGPPSIVKPSHELYGELLLRAGKADEALAQFEAGLARAPRRALSLAGLAEAARASGDGDLAAEACGELASIRSAATAGDALLAACGG